MNSDIYIAIVVLAAVLAAMRGLGFLLSYAIGDQPAVRRVLDLLPPCAMTAAVAPTLVQGGATTIGAALVAVLLGWFTGRVLLSIAIGLVLILMSAHLV